MFIIHKTFFFRCSKPPTYEETHKLAYHLSRVNPLPAWTNFSDTNLLPLQWLIDSGAQICESMSIPCYDRKAINFLKEANDCFQSNTDLKANNVIFFFSILVELIYIIVLH